jgi:DsbC/DsbD-like thiol-disulfide interchange protein
MQISVQFIKAAAKSSAALVSAGLFGLAFVADLRADPYESSWILGKKSSLRLIVSSRPSAQGVYRAGVEIRLDPDAHTYWRMPGDAGAAPVFSFEGSDNIAGVTVLYPTPTRIDEAGIDAFGYRGEVTFPLVVTLKDASRPALLALDLQYAVCGHICLPVRAAAQLPLSTSANEGADIPYDGPREASIEAAEAKVPVHLTPAERDAKVAIERDEQAQTPTWRMILHPAESASANERGGQAPVKPDLFAESQQGWYFVTKKGDRPNEFLIVEVERPKVDNARQIPLTLTFTQPVGPNYEFAVDLDPASGKP